MAKCKNERPSGRSFFCYAQTIAHIPKSSTFASSFEIWTLAPVLFFRLLQVDIIHRRILTILSAASPLINPSLSTFGASLQLCCPVFVIFVSIEDACFRERLACVLRLSVTVTSFGCAVLS